MKMRTLAFFVPALFLVTSCTTLMNLMPEVSMKKRQVIYDMVDAMAFPEARELGRSKNRRMGLKKGQWITVLQETLGGDKNVSLTTTKVISVDGTTVVMETESRSASDDARPLHSQVTFENYPVSGSLSYTRDEYDRVANRLRITRVLTREGDGPVTEMPPELLAMARTMTDSALAGSTVRVGEAERQAYDGTYIRTPSCFSHRYTLSVAGITSSGRSLSHSSIPVNGAILIEDEHARATTVAYGYKGATSVFQP
ncbi:hypothetical protein [Desulfoluna spongiiphila]|uniref:Lipoprotein n=1 Tax=Desulfoluna spongiiphila TaxID=419481 RepID=A0A1G5CKL7_9BACT|nr:hypothetical protein [Desulfoluna spongiiphila]SCY02936.1 hypothetical protein SAMN05216233_10371 [Desulfoluna spongiiphila]